MQSKRETLHTPASNHEDELLKSLGLPIARALACHLHLLFNVRITHIKLTNLIFLGGKK
jgi:hypothetical protein